MNDDFPVPRPWGKLRRAEDGAVLASLGLAEHCADVAAVFFTLLEVPNIRRGLARLGGMEMLDDTQVARLCVLAALHDLGKVNHGFQNKALPKGTAAVEGHIACVVGALSDGILLRALAVLEEATIGWFVDDEATSVQALLAILSHHGGPPEDSPMAARGNPKLWQPAGSYAPLAALTELARAALDWFPAHRQNCRPLPPTGPFWHGFAGLVALADRLGSDERVFTYPGGPAPGESRIAFARRTARRIVADRFLRPDRSRAAAAALDWSFGALFPSFSAPQFAQAAVLSAALPAGKGSLAILEAETGSGKTEAALLHFLRLFRAGMVDGIYFALPTRVSAVQIMERIRKTLDRLLGTQAPPVILAVPGYLRVDDVDGTALPGFKVTWPDDETGTMRDRGWAAEHPSRYLAGAVVVGTIDQVLLSGLDVKDCRLRAASLMRSLLVVDEVHASDAYMVRLLESVLRFRAAAGSHTLLMSATLGEDARARLVATLGPPSWTSPVAAPDVALRQPYPMLTGLPVNDTEPLPEPRRRIVSVRLEADATNLVAVARTALSAANRGARMLIIVNTVNRAMAIQQALEEEAGDSPLLFTVNRRSCPHHARYAAEDRRLLDREVERRFGRGAIGPVILIATQTVEQSLDIDADLLITDLCPADVLLQRLGRLHRHPQRNRPAGFEEPRAIILAPTVAELGEALERPGRFGMGFGKVYTSLTALAATRRTLETGPQLALPDDNRSLVEAATHPELLRQLATSLGGGWPKAHEGSTGDAQVKRTLAGGHVIKWAEPLRAMPKALGEEAATRLGLRDALVRLPEATTGPFGEAVSTIKLPGWMLPNDWIGSEVEELTSPAPYKLTFRFAGVGFVYDRLGLRVVASG